MSDLTNTPEYYRATLKEMVTRLQYPGALTGMEIVQNGKTAECLLYVLDRLEKIEARLDQIEANHV